MDELLDDGANTKLFELQRTWDALLEDTHGHLIRSTTTFHPHHPRLTPPTTPPTTPTTQNQRVKRGLLRHSVLVLDMSVCMASQEFTTPHPPSFKPTFAQVLMTTLASHFFSTSTSTTPSTTPSTTTLGYFDENPIASLGIIGTRDGLALRLSDMSGNPHHHMAVIHDRLCEPTEFKGDMSIYNALLLAHSLLQQYAGSTANSITIGTGQEDAKREILIIHASLSSRDPISPLSHHHHPPSPPPPPTSNTTAHRPPSLIQSLLSTHTQVNVISLTSSLHLLEQLARRTGGTARVAMDVDHLKELLAEWVKPQVIQVKHSLSRVQHVGAHLMKMGFPTYVSSSPTLQTPHVHAHAQVHEKLVSLCACHHAPLMTHPSSLSTSASPTRPTHPSTPSLPIQCPQCLLCGSLPTTCPLCSLKLVASIHLARSFHYLFPPPHQRLLVPSSVQRQPTDTDTALDKDTHKEGCELWTCFGCHVDWKAGSGSGGGDGVVVGTGGYGEWTECTKCACRLCADCGVYVWDVLRTCPGCT